MSEFEEDFETTEFEDFVDQLNAEDLEREYIILWDYDDQEIEFYDQVGFPYYYEAVIDGCDCVVVCQSDEMEWLDEEFVERYWDGFNWHYPQEEESEETEENN